MQGTAGAMGGNNLECRAYHAGAAAAAPVLHCPHAGPAGDSVCGSNCESFCTVAINKCASQFQDNLATCTTQCNAFVNSTATYNSNSVSGDSFACRMYHLTVAATDTASATTHCPHITPVSAACHN
jgi:hypothetical protein